MMMSVLALVVLAVASETVQRTRYDGDVVYRVHVNQSSVTTLLNAVEALELDLWTDIRPALVSSLLDVRVPRTSSAKFHALGLMSEVMIPNLQELLDREQAQLDNKTMNNDFFTAYRTWDEISAFVLSLATTYPQLATRVTVGSTSQGRTIYGLRIASTAGVKRGTIISIGGQHAREWISPAVVTYLANELASKYNSDDTVKQLVDTFNFVFIPVVNIDGYMFTQQTRMWRKTRNTNPGSTCLGTDPNRNWGYQWNRGGSSNNPCQDTYHGTGPFSAIEVRTVADYISSVEDAVAFIDWHAYSQLWMYPWGWSCSAPLPDRGLLDGSSRLAVGALRSVYGTNFGTGSSCNVIYLASGGVDDWTYADEGIVYSFSVELRDTGRFGFILPPDQIVPSGIETFEGLRGLAQYIAGH